MIEQSQKLSIKKTKVEDTQVVYHLVFQNALYDFECFVEGKEDNNYYCYIENITEDEGEAETFFKQMVKGRVHPVLIQDMVLDYFGK